MYDETFMRRAIALSEQALGEAGAGPFAAVIVRDGAIVGEGINRSRAKHDPTSHGEVEAIRDACGRLKTVDLSGCDLYTTCEPCTMCVDHCPVGPTALEIRDGAVVVHEDCCTGCGVCQNNCPTDPKSITVTPRALRDGPRGAIPRGS